MIKGWVRKRPLLPKYSALYLSAVDRPPDDATPRNTAPFLYNSSEA